MRNISWPRLAVALAVLAMVGALGWALAGRSHQDQELAALRAEVEQVKRAGRQRDRATMLAAARLGESGARLAAAAPPPPAGQPPPSPEEQEQAEERLRADFQERHRAYAHRLHARVRAGVADAAARTRLEKQLAPLLQPKPGAPTTALSLDSVDCSRELCRVELGWQGPSDPARLANVARQLVRDSAGLSMAPAEDGRAVYYIGASGHPLPSLDQ